jgi:uncharacterized protein (TIGR02231 family)
MLKTTHIILFFTVLIFGAMVVPAQSTDAATSGHDPVILNSKISEVTVYADRAQVKRTAEKYLAAGEHRLIFDKIPDSLQSESIRIDGKGNFVLMDFKLKVVNYSEISHQDFQLLEKKQKDLKFELNQEKDKITEIEKAKDFIGQVAKKVTENKNKIDTSELNPDNWIKMFNFYREKNDTLNKELRTAQQQIESINSQLETLKGKKRDAEGLLNKSKKQVEVLVKVKKEGNIRLSLSYIVEDSRWVPVYDLRVDSGDNKNMHITYSAVIRQNTSEDWNNVMIKLSTTQPGISSSHPGLTPWRISMQPEYAVPKARNPWTVLNALPGVTVDRKDVGGADSGQQSHFVAAPAGENYFQADGMGAKKEWEMDGLDSITQDAELESGGKSVLFVLKDRNTIKSDDLAHKVIIMTGDFPAYFRYSCVPKLQSRAYLKAKVKNSTGYPLLAGWANVFLNNSFICRTQLKYTSPDQEFWTWLGHDEDIEVKYKFIRNFSKNKKRILGKKNSLIYESLIIIKNNKKTEEEIVIWDQVPISDNKELTVKHLEPEFTGGTPVLKKNKTNFLEWRCKLGPGQEQEIPFKFAIEYPKNMSLVNKK